MPSGHVTLFGGTGFLGRRIAAQLLDRGLEVRIACREPQRSRANHDISGRLETVEADVRDDASVTAAVEGAKAVINAVGLYVERGKETFEAIHVDGARRVAEVAQQAGVERLLHISGIGAAADSPSSYVRCRAQGEAAVREAFAEATIFRPSALFGRDDAFLTTFISLTRRLPVLPLFGRGATRLQPVFVDDVAEAACRVATGEAAAAGRIYELGGPDILSYRDFLRLIGRHVGRKRLLVPVPFAIWDGLAALAGLLPSPPLTDAQVALMKQDNIAAPDLPGLKELGVTPTTLKTVLKEKR